MLKLGVLMDDIAHINPKKDSSLAMMLAAQKRGWPIAYFMQSDLCLENGVVMARVKYLTVYHDLQRWYSIDKEEYVPLSSFDVVFMRKDPPFDIEYIYTTYLLELANVWVVNKPSGLRDFNEKLSTAWFPECCPPTMVTRNLTDILKFYHQHGDIILKPLAGMGGRNIFRIKSGDANANAIIQILTDEGQQTVMAQRFIPEISQGDKRVFLVGGKPIPYALSRIPAADDFRGNLVQGAKGVVIELSERDREIAETVGPVLLEKGFLFVGLDIIGDYLTEINVTSPTGLSEIEAVHPIDIAGQLLDLIEAQWNIRV